MGLRIFIENKSFDKRKIFENFSLELPDRGVFLLSGESGVGKTTLLRMISGLDTKFSGEISGGGVKNCSIAFQEYRLFPELSALDNVILANYDKKTAENEKEAKEMLISLGFNEDDLNLHPSELSGGMKQRVSLARAFLRKAPILLLDEPTKELDEENAKKALSRIKIEAEQRLVLAVSHRQEDAELLGAEIIKI
ncbi:MAG: ABC transporter ATP-binding protein [Clostridia bacterium]|nr:ABC transporter ATP-binding protein [Clostridia bacterium]